MRRLMTGAQMKEIDAYACSEIGIPSMVLMERAALSVAEEIRKEWSRRTALCLEEQRIAAFCGTGNNGADGAAVIRILFLQGCRHAVVITVGQEENWSWELRAQIQICQRLGIEVCSFQPEIWNMEKSSFALIIDALFGVGLSRPIHGIFSDAVAAIGQNKQAFTTAVDIPSGICSATGAVLGCAVSADLTVTFGFEKLGCVLYPGRNYCGKMKVAEIGFPDNEHYSGHRYVAYGAEDWSRLPVRRADSHKGTYGKLLIAAGSEGMCGAAYLSALAAYRMGAGLVKILTVRANLPILQMLLPEAIIRAYDPALYEDEPEQFQKLVEEECAWASAIVLGPGLGKQPHVKRLVELILLSAYVPIVLDADALNVVAEYPYLADFLTENVIVTPHLGEMSRLTGKEIAKLRQNLPEAAYAYSEETGVICVLKDSVTVTAGRDGMIYIGDSGSSALAKGGSGDVLAGTIGGLLALGLSEEEAASFGVWVHGMAGSLAGKEKGEHSVLAEDTANALLRKE